MGSETEDLWWEKVSGRWQCGLERARVEGGWLYRSVLNSPVPRIVALAFVPDRAAPAKDPTP
jgi:hypothetical protein